MLLKSFPRVLLIPLHHWNLLMQLMLLLLLLLSVRLQNKVSLVGQKKNNFIVFYQQVLIITVRIMLFIHSWVCKYMQTNCTEDKLLICTAPHCLAAWAIWSTKFSRTTATLFVKELLHKALVWNKSSQKSVNIVLFHVFQTCYSIFSWEKPHIMV